MPYWCGDKRSGKKHSTQYHDFDCRDIDTLFTALLPHKHLQERSLNIVSLLDRFGVEVVDQIYDSLDLDDKGHRVLYL